MRLFLLAIALVLSLAPKALCDEFVFGTGGSDSLRGESLEFVSSTYNLTLLHDNRDGGDPTSGWSLSVVADNAVITDITTNGTISCEADECPGIGLSENGFNQTEFAVPEKSVEECEGLSGAVSAIVLSLTRDVDLPANQTLVIARIEIETRIPDVGERAVTLRYVDGCVGSGQPVDTVVAPGGVSLVPTKSSKEIALLTREPVGPFLRGDCDGDGKVGGTPADALVLLEWAFAGGDTPPCLASCDMNLDGKVSGNPADAVLSLTYSVLGGEPPPGPFPGCGPGTETDLLLGCETSPPVCP